VSVAPRSIAELETTIKNQIGAALSQTIPLFPKAFTNIAAKVFAAVYVVLYKYQAFGILQIFVRHASAEATAFNGKTVVPLFEWGQWLGVGLPLEGQRAEHTVSLGVITPSGTLAQGTVFLRKSTGVLYESLGAVPITGSSITVTVRAFSDQADGRGYGSLGNLVAGDELELANPPAAVRSRAYVIARTVDGADPEDIESSYRQRVWLAIARPRQGGAESDYYSWGRSVPGIVGVWPYEGSTPNRLNVYVEATPESSGSPDGVPTDAQRGAVWNAIQFDEEGLRRRRPAGMLIDVLPITRKALDVRVSGLVAPDVPATRAAVTAAVDQYLRQRRPWISGLDLLPVRNQATVAGIGGVVASTVYANKGTFVRVQLFDGPSERHVYTLEPGQLAKLGAMTWVSI